VLYAYRKNHEHVPVILSMTQEEEQEEGDRDNRSLTVERVLRARVQTPLITIFLRIRAVPGLAFQSFRISERGNLGSLLII
jgi:hypothetical protein